MSNWNQNNRTDDRQDEKPPYSKIFILYGKDVIAPEEFRTAFEKFGAIEDVFIPKDRKTGEARGMAYIKYSKTSSAAAAIEEMHLKTIRNNSKPLKVLLATHRNDKNDNASEKCSRLFIKVSKQATEDEIRNHFMQFGNTHSVYIQKDKSTNESKGLAYVQYNSFLDAAKAYEGCDKHYRAVFAAPKHDLKRERDNRDWPHEAYSHSSASTHKDMFNDRLNDRESSLMLNTSPQNYKSVCVTCTPGLAQLYIERLFNIIPAMRKCQYSADLYNGYSKAIITYDNEKSAAYAVERLNNYEFPSGEILTVKPDNPLTAVANNLTSIVNSFKNAVDSGRPDLAGLASVIAEASSLIKAATSGGMDQSDQGLDCSVNLPPIQPLARLGSKVAQRCFIVCKPNPLPNHVLKDAFCRFGDLIEITSFPYKTFAYAKYASVQAAQDAINVLHGETLCGTYLKVMEADERTPKDNDSRMTVDQDEDNTMNEVGDRKRIKLNDRH